MTAGKRPGIRLIGFDLDGTALNSDKQISPRLVRAVQRAVGAGLEVLPATGRALVGIPESVMALPGLNYALTSNGAKVFRLSDGRTLLSDCFTSEAARDVVRAVRAFSPYVSAYVEGKAYTDVTDYSELEGVAPSFLVGYFLATRVAVPNLEAFIAGSAPVEKVTVHFAAEAAHSAAWQAMQARGGLSVTSSMPLNIELNTATANKGTALVKLAEQLGIARSQVMAVGDGLNDLELLRQVGYGVAMGNAEPEVKAVADALTDSCDDDGLAKAIEAVLPG